MESNDLDQVVKIEDESFDEPYSRSYFAQLLIRSSDMYSFIISPKGVKEVIAGICDCYSFGC